MKVVYVIESITNLNQKINLLKMKFGNNIIFVVRADLVDLFKTYGYVPNAVYYNNLTRIIQTLLLNGELQDVVICYSSLKFDNELLTKFTNAIGNKSKIVSLMPKYNKYEQICNSTYNMYVKSLFNVKDSMSSPKLQFIPADLLIELLSSHLGNRLFELNPQVCKNIQIENKEVNNSLKIKTKSTKCNLISIIVALLITTLLLASIAYFKTNFLIILTCVIMYIADIILTAIFHFKSKFDNRFLK